MFAKFGEWLPDLPDILNPGLVNLENAIPQAEHYVPAYNISNVSTNALNGFCLGAAGFLASSGAGYNFFGTASKLYKLNTSNAFEDLSKVGGYAVASGDKWHFAQVGDIVVAVNGADSAQAFTMDVSSVFANLGGSPPVAKYVASCKGFLFLGNLAASANQVQCSSYANVASYTGDMATLFTLDSAYGPIKQLLGGEYVTVFTDLARYRMTFIGSPDVFRIDRLEADRGLYASNCAVQFSDQIFYLAPDGFYLASGNQSVPIGKNKINNYFFQTLNLTYAYNACAVHDIQNNLIKVFYPSQSSNGTTLDRMLAFDYITGRWGNAVGLTTTYVFPGRSSSYTIDGLDTTFSTIDSIPYSFDSAFWNSKNAVVVALSADNKSATFSGDALTTILETGEVPIAKDAKKTILNWIKPEVGGSALATVAVGSRNNISDDVTYTGDTMLNDSGLCPFRVEARYLRAKVRIAGGYTKAVGVEIITPESGASR